MMWILCMLISCLMISIDQGKNKITIHFVTLFQVYQNPQYGDCVVASLVTACFIIIAVSPEYAECRALVHHYTKFIVKHVTNTYPFTFSLSNV